MILRVGTRGSELALTQTRSILALLGQAHPDLELEEIILRSEGDRDPSTPLHQAGGAGVFTGELEKALLEDRIDLAVHSLKDLPTRLPEGLGVAAVPERASPWDAWISSRHAGPQDVEGGGVVLTGSPRRKAQLLHVWPHLDVQGVRGNIDTRLERATDPSVAGLVLAAAGLGRIGRADRIRIEFGPTEMTPAPGQGALGLQTRDDDPAVDRVRVLDHGDSHRAVRAERAMLARLEAGCHMPVGGFARVVRGTLSLLGMAATPDGGELLRMAHEGDPDEPERVGEELAEMLLGSGAGDMLAECEQPGREAD